MEESGLFVLVLVVMVIPYYSLYRCGVFCLNSYFEHSPPSCEGFVTKVLGLPQAKTQIFFPLPNLPITI